MYLQPAREIYISCIGLLPSIPSESYRCGTVLDSHEIPAFYLLSSSSLPCAAYARYSIFHFTRKLASAL
jgi:hypothetical protein